MTPHRLFGLTLALTLLPAAARPADDDKDDKAEVLSLSLELSALQMLHDFRATPEQFEALAKVLKDTAGKMPDRKAPKVSAKMLSALRGLRDALAAGDEDKIFEAGADLDEIKESEALDLDEDFDLTDAARKQAADVLARFSPRQAAVYLAVFADDFPLPRDKLLEAVDAARTKEGQEWEDERDAVAGQVGWLVGGIDQDAEAKVRDKAAALLDRAHKLKDADFKAQKADLEKEAAELAARAGPTDVVKNFLLRTTAELLSNPRAPAAVEARLKKLK
jgi:hypothetical protein